MNLKQAEITMRTHFGDLATHCHYLIRKLCLKMTLIKNEIHRNTDIEILTNSLFVKDDSNQWK